MTPRKSLAPPPAQEQLVDVQGQDVAWQHPLAGIPGGEAIDPSLIPEGSLEEIERKRSLIRALELVGMANQRSGMLKDDGIQKQKGRPNPKMRGPRHADNVRSSRDMLLEEAATAFQVGIGAISLRGAEVSYDSSDPASDPKLRQITFFSTYGRPGWQTRKLRAAKIKQLQREIMSLVSTTEAAVTEDPLETVQNEALEQEATLYKLDTLSPVQRIKSLLTDERAGFMATTMLESGIELVILDYLDNPKYEAGVFNWLLEIVRRGHKLNARYRKEGKPEKVINPNRPTETIVYELADFLNDSERQLANFSDLEAQLNESIGRDNITIGEEAQAGLIDASLPGFIDLLRHRDLRAFVKYGRGVLFENPTQNVEDRFRAEGSGPGRHKYIYDIYTDPKMSDEKKQAIRTAVESMTVGEAKILLDDAKDLQSKRQEFLREKVLLKIAHGMLPSGELTPHALKAAVKAAQRELFEKRLVAAHA